MEVTRLLFFGAWIFAQGIKTVSTERERGWGQSAKHIQGEQIFNFKFQFKYYL